MISVEGMMTTMIRHEYKSTNKYRMSVQHVTCTGMKGQTSSAPMRGCSPWCVDISMRAAAVLAAANAPSTTASGLPTKVYTVLRVMGFKFE